MECNEVQSTSQVDAYFFEVAEELRRLILQWELWGLFVVALMVE